MCHRVWLLFVTPLPPRPRAMFSPHFALCLSFTATPSHCHLLPLPHAADSSRCLLSCTFLMSPPLSLLVARHPASTCRNLLPPFLLTASSHWTFLPFPSLSFLASPYHCPFRLALPSSLYQYSLSHCLVIPSLSAVPYRRLSQLLLFFPKYRPVFHSCCQSAILSPLSVPSPLLLVLLH